MNKRISMRIISILVLTLTAAAVHAGGVALLLGRNNSHNKEFDAAFEKLGWMAERFNCNAEDMKKLTDQIDKFDLILSVPLFNWGGHEGKWLLAEDATDYKAIKKYLEGGGTLVLTDGSYPQVRDWLAQIDSALGGLSTGDCNSSQWAVNGTTTNEEPVHTIRKFPNMIVAENNSWPHFMNLPKDSKWHVLARCSEGNPVVLYQDVGKGTVILTCLRQPSELILENYRAYSQLHKSGIRVKDFSMSDLKPGAGHLRLELDGNPPAGTKVIYEITGENNKTATFVTNFVNSVCNLDFRISIRGPVSASLYFEGEDGRKLLFSRNRVLPDMFRAFPNAYRGILSTKRRTDNVSFRFAFAPDWEDLRGAKLSFTIYDSDSNKITSVEQTLSANLVSSEVWVPVSLSKQLPPGEYRLDGRVVNAPGCSEFDKSSSCSFEIVPPNAAQVVIDEDKTFLVNGAPFFPLGIYHIPPSDYKTASDIGFNTVQFWKWDGILGLDAAVSNTFRCIFESNHSIQVVGKECVQHFGNHPAILMWYVADEPTAGQEKELEERNNIWHNDKNHPTYIVSCREDLFGEHRKYGDVLGFDPYDSEPVNKAIQWCRTATKVSANRQPIVVVPWSTAEEPETLHAVAFASIVHDARGIVWYPWKQAGGGPLGIGLHNDKKCLEMHRKICSEVKIIEPGLLSEVRRPFEEGGIHGMVCGTSYNNRFVIMINVTNKPIDAEFAVPELANVNNVTLPLASKVEKKDKNGDPVMTVDSLAIENGIVKYAFKPYEVLVYRW